MTLILNRWAVMTIAIGLSFSAFANETRLEYYPAKTGKLVNYDARKHSHLRVRLFIISNFWYRNGHPESGAYSDMKADSSINKRVAIRPDGTFEVPALVLNFEPGSFDIAFDGTAIEVTLEDMRTGRGVQSLIFDRSSNFRDDRWASRMRICRAAYDKLWRPFRIQ